MGVAEHVSELHVLGFADGPSDVVADDVAHREVFEEAREAALASRGYRAFEEGRPSSDARSLRDGNPGGARARLGTALAGRGALGLGRPDEHLALELADHTLVLRREHGAYVDD